MGQGTAVIITVASSLLAALLFAIWVDWRATCVGWPAGWPTSPGSEHTP
jgi:hypothetical protein